MNDPDHTDADHTMNDSDDHTDADRTMNDPDHTDADHTMDDPDTDEALIQVLTEVRDGIADVRGELAQERTGRHLSQRLTWLTIAILALFVVVTVAVERASVTRDRQQLAQQVEDRRVRDCERSNERRDEVRAAIVAAVDEVTILAGTEADMTRRLLEGVDARVAAELPPNVC